MLSYFCESSSNISERNCHYVDCRCRCDGISCKFLLDEFCFNILRIFIPMMKILKRIPLFWPFWKRVSNRWQWAVSDIHVACNNPFLFDDDTMRIFGVQLWITLMSTRYRLPHKLRSMYGIIVKSCFSFMRRRAAKRGCKIGAEIAKHAASHFPLKLYRLFYQRFLIFYL